MTIGETAGVVAAIVAALCVLIMALRFRKERPIPKLTPRMSVKSSLPVAIPHILFKLKIVNKGSRELHVSKIGILAGVDHLFFRLPRYSGPHGFDIALLQYEKPKTLARE